MVQLTRQFLEQLEIELSHLGVPVKFLSGGQRQSIAIAKAVSNQAKVVVLDEPTAAFGVVQTENGLNLVKNLRDKGLCIVYISHNREEVFRVADRMVVLKNGRVVGERRRADTDRDEIARLIITGRGMGHDGAQSNADPTPRGSGPRAPEAMDRSGMLVLERLQPLLILIAVVALMTVLSPKFFSVNNLMTIGVQGTVQAILAIGVTLVIISGGLDLSIGTVMSLTMVVMGTLVINLGLPLEIGILCAVLTGALVGLVNDGLIACTALPPFIVTLGMLGIAQGLALAISDGYSMYGFPDSFQNIAWESFAGIPIPPYILAVVAVFVFGQTKLGRYACTIGGNEEAVRRSGVNVRLDKTFIYVFAGVMSGIASVVPASRVNSRNVRSARPGHGS